MQKERVDTNNKTPPNLYLYPFLPGHWGLRGVLKIQNPPWPPAPPRSLAQTASDRFERRVQCAFTITKMPKGRKRARETQAAAEERAMKRIDRAVKRYGPSAVAKYYTPRSAIRPNMKYFDVNFDGVALSTANDWSAAVLQTSNYIGSDGTTVSASGGAYAALIPSATGSGYGQTQGNKYHIRKLKLRGLLLPEAATGGTVTGLPCRSRLIMLMDKQPNGVQAQPTDLLTDWASAANNLDSFLAVGSGGASRYRVLMDRTFIHRPAACVNNAAGTTVSTTYEPASVKMTKTFKKPIVVSLKGGVTTISLNALYDCNIYLVGLHYNQSGGTPGSCKLWATSRCCYID